MPPSIVNPAAPGKKPPEHLRKRHEIQTITIFDSSILPARETYWADPKRLFVIDTSVDSGWVWGWRSIDCRKMGVESKR